MRILLLFLFVYSFSHAQAIRLGQFNKVKVFDGIRLTIIPSDADSLVVEGKTNPFCHIRTKMGDYIFVWILKSVLADSTPQ